MRKNRGFWVVVFLMMAAVAVVGLAPVNVSAADLNPICDKLEDDKQKEAAGCDVDKDELTNQIPVAVNVILWIAGVLAVVMIIYAGLQMVISSGDSSKTETAKKTLTYAVVGLVVVIFSYVIVGFVVGQFGGGGGEGATEQEQVEEEPEKEIQVG